MDVRSTTATRSEYGINRLTAIILGAILVIVGLWGYAQDPVLGLFDVGPIHNLVHLLTGAILLAAAFINNGAFVRTTNITLGVVYLIVAFLGFVVPGFLIEIFDFNMADNWLHVLLGVVLVGVGFAARGEARRPVTGAIR